MSMPDIIDEIIMMGATSSGFKPHKFVLLLAVIDLYSGGKITENRIFYNRLLIDAFTNRFEKNASAEDRNRPYNPFFHLRKQSFWSLVPKYSKKEILNRTSSIGGPGQLNELVECATLSDEFYSLINDDVSRNKLRIFIEKLLKKPHETEKMRTVNSASQQQNQIIRRENMTNSFLNYINSLHSIDGHCSGALAEQQSRSPFFSQIQVPHPLTGDIRKALQSERHCHYILTGHAGDGKSSIALELYKLFSGIPADQPLSSGLRRREDFSYNGFKISLIKDLSEWTAEEQKQLFSDMWTNSRRYLLISNTGSLLQLFKYQADVLGFSQIEVENQLLTAMDSVNSQNLDLGAMHLIVSNLALQDNIDLALKVWEKMLHANGWKHCDDCPYHSACPVFENLQLLRKHQERITGRMRFLLRRTQLYGGRLTMRQYCAHFAYMLGSGLDAKKLLEQLKKGKSFSSGEYFFFNRFFGETGGKTDFRSSQLQAVRLFNSQGFETRLSSAMEHYLWLKDDTAKMKPGIPELETSFYPKLYARATAEETEAGKLELQNARKQLRRLYFFLYTPPESADAEKRHAFDEFLRSYVNSPVLLDYEQWQRDTLLFDDQKNARLEQIYQVLQEQFSGLRLPEGSQDAEKILYMTLARRERDIRQSAQIVLGKLNFSDHFTLSKIGREIYLCVTNYDLKLELPLPFLDYIYERKKGEIGTAIQPGFVDRLENFKSKLLTHCQRDNDDKTLLLIKQTGRHGIRQQRLSFTNHRLEVPND